MVTTDTVGGVWRYAIELAAGLAHLGGEVTLVAMGPSASPAQRAEAQAVPSLTFIDTGLPLDWTADNEDALDGAVARLREIAGGAGVRSAHLHAPALVGSTPWPVPVVAVAHSCVATWWRAVRGDGRLPPDLAWRVEATGRGLRHADAKVAPSRAFAAAIEAEYGIRDVRVIHNGRRPLPNARPAERAVLAAGRLWDEGKGIAALDRAAAVLSAPVRAAGRVEGPGGTARFANLDLLGELDEDGMAAARGRATVFAAPARYEPFGLAVLEAAQAGQALVLSDIPTFRELWDGAALFAPGDDALAETIERALDDPAQLAAKARERAELYGWNQLAVATAAVHAEVLTH
jgi:glycosyltransferase involved in cell wall biosynthesis